jgi:alpha-tubulin suppressor-like RCC1 family protein
MRRLSVAALCAAMTLLVCAALSASAWATTGGLAWGNNEFGQLGNGSKQSGSTITSVAEPTAGELSGMLQVSTGGDHTLALLAGKGVDAWGNGEWGQLGLGGHGTHALPVSTGLESVTAVAAGKSFSMALKAGVVWTWGRNNRGQVGDGFVTGPNQCGAEEEGESKEHQEERACLLSPAPLGLSKVVAIAAGGEHALALLEDGTVKAWGSNQFGQLGTGSSTGPEKCAGVACSRVPVTVTGLEHVVAISAGAGWSMALLESGEVVSWGSNKSGQLGTGSGEGPETCASVACSTKAVSVTGLSEVKAISAGGEFGLAVTSGNEVKAWGNNEKGQLGNNTTTNSATPVAVLEAVGPSKNLSGVQAISAGGKHALALVEGEVLKVWGDPSEGALGPGILNNKIAQNAAIGSIAAISAGERQTVVIGAAGPAITKLEPESGLSTGGYPVKIKGTNLSSAQKVFIGSEEVPGANWSVSGGEVTIKEMPPEAPGVVVISVKTERATTATTSAAKFRYEPIGSIALGRCLKVTSGTGTYKNGGCTEPLIGGNFAWEAFGTGFAGAIAPETTLLLETTGGVALACTGETSVGAWVPTKAAQGVVLKLTGCEMLIGKCKSAGAAAGEIVTAPLEGALGFFEKETNKVGLELFPEEKPSTTVFEATCGATSVTVSGAVIGQIGTVNKMNSSFTLKLKQHSGKQTIEKLEGESAKSLRLKVGSELSIQAGLSLESSLNNETSIEINTNI